MLSFHRGRCRAGPLPCEAATAPGHLHCFRLHSGRGGGAFFQPHAGVGGLHVLVLSGCQRSRGRSLYQEKLLQGSPTILLLDVPSSEGCGLRVTVRAKKSQVLNPIVSTISVHVVDLKHQRLTKPLCQTALTALVFDFACLQEAFLEPNTTDHRPDYKNLLILI